MHVEIRPFQPASASAGEWQALNQLENLREHEIFPADPVIPLEQTHMFWQNLPPIARVSAWLALSPSGEPLGYATCELLDLDEHRHMAQGRLFVAPEFRRQGIGSRCLAQVVGCAQADGRRSFMSDVFDRVPDGLEFAQRMGAEVGLATHVNQLDLLQVDRELLQRWQQRAAGRAGDFELLFWDGAYPEAELEQMAAMMESMNDAPMGSLDVEDIRFTPEILRQMEAFLLGRGFGRWTFVARHRPSGDLAGYTEISWSPVKINVGSQGGTGVLSRYRGYGLGRWLKAVMLEKVLDERPQVRFIRTANADMNAPMLKINQELGFQPYLADSMCQVELHKLAEILKDKGYLYLA